VSRLSAVLFSILSINEAEGLTDLNRIAFFNEHFRDAAGEGGRHFDGAFFRFDFDQRLPLGDFVAGSDLDVENVSAGKILP